MASLFSLLARKLRRFLRASADIANLLSATEDGMLLLNRDLRIELFNKRVAPLFELGEADEGKPIGDFSSRLQYGGLVDDAREVLSSSRACQRQVRTADGHEYLLRIAPYVAAGRIDGVVVTLVDRSLRGDAEYVADSVATGTAVDEASALAHELNQPLAAGATYLKVARRRLETEGEGRKEVLEALDKAAGQMLRAGVIVGRLRDSLGCRK